VQLKEGLAAHGREDFGSFRWPIVSLGYGGNNLKFRSELMDCIGVDANGALTTVAGGLIGWLGAPWVGCSASEQDLLTRVDRLTDPASVSSGQHLSCPDAPRVLSDTDPIPAGVITIPELYQFIDQCVVAERGAVVVMGYPQLVEESGRWDGGLLEGNRCQRIRRADVGRLRSAVARLNDKIRQAVLAEAARSTSKWVFVDPNKSWEGSTDKSRHALC
jgi:hypothetical protein